MYKLELTHNEMKIIKKCLCAEKVRLEVKISNGSPVNILKSRLERHGDIEKVLSTHFSDIYS